MKFVLWGIEGICRLAYGLIFKDISSDMVLILSDCRMLSTIIRGSGIWGMLGFILSRAGHI